MKAQIGDIIKITSLEYLNNKLFAEEFLGKEAEVIGITTNWTIIIDYITNQTLDYGNAILCQFKGLKYQSIIPESCFEVIKSVGSKCDCDIMVLMARGCQCGKEKK